MTEHFPREIAEAFQRHAFSSGRAAWITLDSQQRLIAMGGEFSRLGLPALEPGQDPRSSSDLVAALLDVHDNYEVLPRVEVAPGVATDVHRGRLLGGGTFLLLFDVSEDASSETHLRQRGLDLGRLLRGIGSESLKRTRVGVGWEEILQSIESAGPLKRQRVAVIRVRLIEPKDRKGAELSDDPPGAVSCCESALRRVLEVLMVRTGAAELDGSCAVQSWCGLALGARDPAERALGVASILVGLFKETDPSGATIAVGVATGPVAVGKMALPGGPRLAVLGSCTKRVMGLAEAALSGQILLDENTASAAVGARVEVEKHGSIELMGPVYRVR